MVFLKTLDWNHIHDNYNDYSEMMKYVISQYMEYFAKHEKEYNDKMITIDYIESSKKELLKVLYDKYHNSKSLIIKNSCLITTNYISHFLNTIDWTSYCRTEDCYSKSFKFIIWQYHNYLIKNVIID